MNEQDWIEAYSELVRDGELDVVKADEKKPLSAVIDEYAVFPPEALFMGLAEDGLPLLLNLHDPVPGALLLIGEDDCDKTGFLRMIAHAIGLMHPPADVQFGVLTRNPEEWEGTKKIANNVGIFPVYDTYADNFILAMASWANGRSNAKQSVVLLLDGLENIGAFDFETRQNLRWLFLKGASRRVWTIASIDRDKVPSQEAWVDAFPTHIYGIGGGEFMTKEAGKFIKFWSPAVG
jgi:hypothetical protein